MAIITNSVIIMLKVNKNISFLTNKYDKKKGAIFDNKKTNTIFVRNTFKKYFTGNPIIFFNILTLAARHSKEKHTVVDWVHSGEKPISNIAHATGKLIKFIDPTTI